ncbi:MAG: DM13 domain-containing protein, partial [Actinomycetota bacterium]|nr:DM13 domain-containing protein [Actinomycetota bacterium]
PKRLSGGRLDGIGHTASGSTALYEIDGRGVLRFDDVDIEGTPSPYVYLVPRGAREPDSGVLVGPLKAERGSFSYALPASVDLNADWTVLLWCRPYDTPIAASDH